MDEGLDESVDVCAEAVDLPVSESMDTVEPIADIPVEDSTMDSLNETEPSLSGQEIADLQNEAEALEIEPLNEQQYEPSAFGNMANAVTEGALSPSPGAQIAGEIFAPPGAGEALAQGLQMGVNAGIAGSREFMDATIRQHGISPAAALENMQINQAIEAGSKSLDESSEEK